jgi:curli biogenesis system outer membrane secretion channel CsgG
MMMRLASLMFALTAVSFGQGTPAPAAQSKPAAAAKPAAKSKAPAKAPAKAAAAAPKAESPIDAIIALKKAGMGDDLIIKSILREKKPVDVGIADLKRLKDAGVSDRIIGALMDPSSAAAAPAPAATAAATPAAAAPAASSSAVPSTPAPVAGAVATAPTGPVKRRLAIEPFDYSTVRTVSQSIFKTEVDIGNGIRALLTKRIQETGKISVLERSKINTVMQEQDFGASNRVKKGTNAKVGRILGADAVLMGDIVTFGRDDTDNRVNVGAVTRRFGLGNVRVGNQESKAVVVINYRIVDAETSEIISTGEARGESSRKSKGIGGMVGVDGVYAGGKVDMTSSNFAQTIIGEATMDACNKLAAVMNDRIPNLPAKAVEVEARVADATNTQLTITAGSEAGVVVGDRFEVFKILSEVKDPVTKEVLDLKLEKVGDLIIATVRERISVGNYGGTAAAAVGYVVQKRPTQ